MTDTTPASRPAHTPGPWKVSTLFDKNDALLIEGPEGSGVTVARVACFGAQAEHPHAQLPNARLIAAAPDLYDAAENALDTLLSCCVAGDGVDDREAMLEAQQMLRAAIAKATGSAS